MNNPSNSSLIGSWEDPPYMPTSEERTQAILSHILNLVAPLLAPLIIYVIKKDESKFVADHAKESLNFQITIIIGYIIGVVTALFLVGIFILMFLGLVELVLIIVATVKASDNKIYRYPFNIRLIK